MFGVLDRATDHIKAAVTGDSASRLSQRREQRLKLSQCEVVRQRVAIEEKQLRTIDARVEAAVNQHQEICGPIQSRLAEIDATIAQHLADREPLPPKLESERLQLLETRNAANESLAIVTETLNKLRGPIAKTIRELQAESSQWQVLRNELAKSPLANPRLLLEQHAAAQNGVWQKHRLLAGRKQLDQSQHALQKIVNGSETSSGLNQFGHHIKRNRGNVEQSADYKVMQARVDRWQFEVEAATAALAAADADGNRIYKAMIDE